MQPTTWGRKETTQPFASLELATALIRPIMLPLAIDLLLTLLNILVLRRANPPSNVVSPFPLSAKHGTP